MPEKIIKGVDTNQGIAKYDYNSLANIPSLKTINGEPITGDGDIVVGDGAVTVIPSPVDVVQTTGNSETAVMSQQAVTNELDAIFNTIYCETVKNPYVSGGIQLNTATSDAGSTNNLKTRARTSGYISSPDLVLTIAEGYYVWVAFYSASNEYLGYSPKINAGSNMTVFQYAPEGAVKSIIVVGKTSNADITDFEAVAAAITAKKRPGSISSGSSGGSSELTVDVPENPGVLNTILKMRQLRDITVNYVASMPQTLAYWSPGPRKGMPYSSTRPEALFVPQCVSLYTYVSAASNPNSYLYTVDLFNEYNNENGKTYYGAVCSTFVGQALGIKPIYSTFQWPYQPRMEIIEPQDPLWLKLGDSFVTKGGGHVLMITGITRDGRGKIQTLEVSDTGSLVPSTVNMTLEKFKKTYPPASYIYCRYPDIYKSQYEQSPFVTVDEDDIAMAPVVFPPLMPRKGDKANYLENGYLTSEYVEIDVLNGDGYSQVEIYKNDSLLKTVDKEALIRLKTSDLGYGKYKACLTDGTNRSDYCYWMIVNTVTTVEDLKNGKIRVTFSSANADAKPVWVQWAGGVNNGTKHITEIDDAARAAGTIECDYPDITNPKVGNSFKIRVAFETEYGTVHGALTDTIELSK
jgi:hypothetical protein